MVNIMRNMDGILWMVILVNSFRIASFENSTAACVIDLECRECVPDHMPLVTSHRARDGRVEVPHGEELRLSCGAGQLLALPGRAAAHALCHAGRYRLAGDARLWHLLDLGCQEDVFEDVLHHVDDCEAPLQGRAYQTQADGVTRHLATLCYDADAAIARHAHAAAAPHDDLRLAPHSDNFAPLTILGNFNHMFDVNTRKDAEALFSDDVSANRRLRELLKHDDISLGEQSVTAAKLLAPHYFEDQNARVTNFPSNKVVSWRGVVQGNWRHVQQDAAAALRAARAAGAPLHVWAGARGALGLRGGARVPVALRAPARFPAPRYLWTALVDPVRAQGIVLVVLNDPLVAVSEIKEAVFCESMCSQVGWVLALRRHRNYETPALGLAFCCAPAAGLLPAAALPPASRPYSLLADLHFHNQTHNTV